MSPDSIPRQIVHAALRENLPFFGIACIVLVAGVSSLSLARLRSRDRLLFWLGIFSMLYAIRLFIQNELVRAALNAPGNEFSALALCLTYIIPIPYALFARELFDRGWNGAITVWLWIQVAFAIAAIPTALVAHQVHWTNSVNGVLVIGGTLLILLHVLFRPEGSNAFARSLTWPLLVSGIFVVLQNRGVRAAGVDIEPLGFLILLGGLGFTASRHAWASERKLMEVEQELATARRIQNSIIPHSSPDLPSLRVATRYQPMTVFAHRGLTHDARVELLHGAQDEEDRERIKAAFQFDPRKSKVRILIATDSASEGIDLQRECHCLIHYEIPWNPNRLEQRNGRIDRHGQRAAEVLVYHFVASGFKAETPTAEDSGSSLAADLEFLYRAARKVEQIREDLGKVGPVIAEQVEEAMLGRRRSLETARAERDNEPVKRYLRFEQNVREQVQRLTQQLDETRRELHLAPENIEAVVHIALELAQQPKLIPTLLEGVPRAFLVPQFADPSWQKCRAGLEHPHTHAERPIAFDPEAVKDRDDVVLAHLNHRMVQRCLRLLRAEIWAPTAQQKIFRVTSRVVPHAALRTPAVLAHARLTVVSRDSQRLHEEVITAGGAIVEGKLDRLNVNQVNELLAYETEREPAESLRQRLATLWPQLAKPLQTALDARGRDRAQSIQRQLTERAASELEKIELIFAELERSIRAELDDPHQMDLFSTYTAMEREQARRNHDFLRDRLRQIPSDLKRELETIRLRYSDPEPRLFPVAVTFLVPEGVKA